MYACSSMSESLFSPEMGSWSLDCMNLSKEATKEWLQHGFIELSFSEETIGHIEKFYEVDLSDCKRVKKRTLNRGEQCLILNTNGLRGAGRATLCLTK